MAVATIRLYRARAGNVLLDTYLYVAALVLQLGWQRLFDGASAYATLCMVTSQWIRGRTKPYEA